MTFRFKLILALSSLFSWWGAFACQSDTVGRTAPDFVYFDIDGKPNNLHRHSDRKPMLLIFYDPDCPPCIEGVEKLATSPYLTQLTESDVITVTAIYSGDDRLLWEETYGDLPDSWIKGYENGDIQEQDLYILQTFPALYLLDGNLRIVAKNIAPNDILSVLSKIETK